MSPASLTPSLCFCPTLAYPVVTWADLCYLRDTGVISLGGAAAEASAEVGASQRYTDNSGCKLSVLEYRMRAGGMFVWLFGGAGRSAVVLSV